MSRIMCLKDCRYKTKTGYCEYSYCDEKPFFLYKDGKYLMIISNKNIIDKNKILEELGDCDLAERIKNGEFDVEIIEREPRK